MRSLQLAAALLAATFIPTLLAQPTKPPAGITIDDAPTIHHLARLDALDEEGNVLVIVAAVYIEPTLLVVPAEALRRAQSLKIDTGDCNAASVIGIVALDPDQRLAIIQIDVPPVGVAPFATSGAPLRAGDSVTCQAMLFALECGFATGALESHAVLSAHRLRSLGHHAAIALHPGVVSGSAVLDSNGNLAGLLEDGRDGTTSVVVSVHELMAAERFEPMTLAEFHARPVPAAIHATQLAQQATVRRDQGRLADARQLLDQAFALDPNCWLAHYEQGVCNDLGDEPDKAVAALTRSFELEPGFCESRYSLGLVHLKQGRHLEAVAPLQDATRLNPGHATAFSMLCLALEATGQLDEAFRAGEASIDLKPDGGGIYANLAIIYDRHDRPDDAIRVWQRRVDDKPRDTPARSQLGNLLFAADRYKECATVLEPILDERRPDSTDVARLALARWYAGDRTGGLAAAKLGAQRYPDVAILSELVRRFTSELDANPRPVPRLRGKAGARLAKPCPEPLQA